jgi:tetratricopeptide (TPR) repeat protein
MMIFACLGEIHAERHQRTKRKADLDEAVWATQLALSISSAEHPITATLLNNLANGLWRRYRFGGHEDDLHRALDYGFQALELLSQEDSNQATVLGALGAIRASLYDCRGDFQDLQEAISITRKSIDIATRCAGSALVILFNNLGVYLWIQYCLTNRVDDLDDSAVSFVKALEYATDNTVDRVTCLINSGHVLTQRYHRTRQLQDLNCALENSKEVVRLDPQNEDLATLLKRLDRFLDRRRDPTSSVHWSKSHGNANLMLGKLLILSAVFVLIFAMYAYHLRTEILLSIVAFPIGIIYHWMSSRRPTAERRISKEDYFAPISSMRRFLGSQGGSHEYTPKLLAVPLIPVPSASSLRGIQSSNFSAYSSILYNQRRQSIQSMKSERENKRRFSTGHHRDRVEKVHKGRHSGYRPMSPPRGSHNETPTIGVMAPSGFVNYELQKESLSSVVRNARPEAEVGLSRNETGSSCRQREAHLVSSCPPW